jgi:RNA polymerase sigma-70 factor (ECF subfamily)
MYYIITPILSNPHDRDECISEISLRLWEKIHLYDETKSNFLTWLTAFVKNTALNQAKKNAKHGDYEDIYEMEDSISANNPTPEQIVLQKEREEELLKALNTLKPQDKLIFYRKYYYMQSTAQIAAEMGMSERAVEGRLYRVKKKLRRELGGEWYG